MPFCPWGEIFFNGYKVVSDFITSDFIYLFERGKSMNRLRYLQLTPGHEEQFHMAKQLWFSFIHEVHEHDGIQQPDHQIVDGLKKKSPYKAVAKICTLNWRLWLMSREAFQCLRLTLERDMVYRRKVTEQLWGCTFDPTFAERGDSVLQTH